MNFRNMTKYEENFMRTTSFIKKLFKIKMVTLLLWPSVCENIAKKSQEKWWDRQNFEQRAINHEIVGQPWEKSNLIFMES